MQNQLIERTQIGNIQVANIRDDFDIVTSVGVERELSADMHTGYLLIVLSACPFMDSLGLRTLIRLSKLWGARMAVVAAPGSRARRIIDLAGTADAFRVSDDLPSALEYFADAPRSFETERVAT